MGELQNTIIDQHRIRGMILAAGLGTRLKTLTDNLPKALIKVNERTLLELAIKKLSGSGIRNIIVNTHHFSDQVIDFLNKNEFEETNVQYTVEEVLLDTGGGIRNAAYFLKESDSFLVHNVDIISNIELDKLVGQHFQSKALVTLAVSRRKSGRYFLFDKNGRLKGWENTDKSIIKIADGSSASLTKMAFSGISVMRPEIFNVLPEKKIFSITDALLDLAAYFPIEAYEHTPEGWKDYGKPESFNG